MVSSKAKQPEEKKAVSGKREEKKVVPVKEKEERKIL